MGSNIQHAGANMAGERILVTGVCGFTGRHLIAHLCRVSSAAVVGSDTLPDAALPLDGYYPCDLTDAGQVSELVNAARPATVFHLAGLMAHAAADEIERVNVCGFDNLARALRARATSAGRRIRLVTVGSAAELGSGGAARLPVAEDAPCAPESAYGRSKYEVTRRALAEPPESPLEIIVARTFNLVGPGLSPHLALGSFARQLAAAMRGETTRLHCGPLDSRRDFIDVRDAARAYVALAERGRPRQLYNVCAGRSHSLKKILDMLITLASVRVHVESDSRRRPGDLKDIYGDNRKIAGEAGWQPAVSIEHSLADLLAAA